MVAFGRLSGRRDAEGEHIPEQYRDLVRPHIESFNEFVTDGLQLVSTMVDPAYISLEDRDDVWAIRLSAPQISMPLIGEAGVGPTSALSPRHCRETGLSYRGRLSMNVEFTSAAHGRTITLESKSCGLLPIMLQSCRCHLAGKNVNELCAMKEEPLEFGGTFICNGNERVLRMVVQQRRHVIMAIRRPAYRKRGALYTDFATVIRCVRRDESSLTQRLHYLRDGSMTVAITVGRAEFFPPVGLLLKALCEVSDAELYSAIVAGCPEDTEHARFVADRAALIAQAANQFACDTQDHALAYLGSLFRSTLNHIKPGSTDAEVGVELLRRHVFVHLPADNRRAKFQLLCRMVHKLLAFVDKQCCEDNSDALAFQEVLLPGQLLMKYAREKIEEAMDTMCMQIRRDIRRKPYSVAFTEDYLRHASGIVDIGARFERLVITGNINARSTLDLMQASGFSIVAERLNFFRYISHFRAVHRGAYFAQSRSTTVRKLLPESWGFMCPVHTPDGAPCGLLNHLAHRANLVGCRTPNLVLAKLTEELRRLGVRQWVSLTPPAAPAWLSVLIDGEVIGYLEAERASAVEQHLRRLKAEALRSLHLGVDHTIVPVHLEVCLSYWEEGGPFPGLILLTQPGRMMRTVKQMDSRSEELIGSLEQLGLHIKCPDGGWGGSRGMAFSHEELDGRSMLSEVANLTPFSDFNQSPRNMYQCQMGKQTMGTPCTAYQWRTDNKLYRLQTPQRPLARTRAYEDYVMDEYPLGTNMVVCVVAYTGYDMEDAMILNKSSVERGMAHGFVYKTEAVDFTTRASQALRLQPQILPPAQLAAFKERHRENPPRSAFDSTFPRNVLKQDAGAQLTDPAPVAQCDHMDIDGLPKIGTVVWPTKAYLSLVDKSRATQFAPKSLKGEEQAVIEHVSIVGTPTSRHPTQRVARVNVKLRLNRAPVIGDKFASRAGQKGVLGQQWPDVDMPYCARTGMRPDLIINPHAFPSRMTIGMLLESMASKAGALEGSFVDASAFQKCDTEDNAFAQEPVKYVGDVLAKHGYARHGQEVMINGFTGEEMPCDIFIGLVYYQRLRHMVKDKFQVRATGKNNPLTRQPVKGRKVGGGIRFGEMERDSLLAHGAAYLLHDRLHYSSDYHVEDVCRRCGSLLTTLHQPTTNDRLLKRRSSVAVGRTKLGTTTCKECGPSSQVERVAMPYVFKYLVAELAMMNIKVKAFVE